jgi:hypothetical protein
VTYDFSLRFDPVCQEWGGGDDGEECACGIYWPDGALLGHNDMNCELEVISPCWL